MSHVLHAPAVTPSAAEEELLDERDLLRIFKKRHIKSIRRWVAEERLPPHFRIGSKRYWRRRVLMDFIARNESPDGRVAPQRTRHAR